MIKVDLVTGFLGSGKTTFLRGYVNYLLSCGEKVCILENDYGAINVDLMLLKDLKSDNLGIEMVSGGCDYDSHKRRFKTKLIAMAMQGYQRVVVEPSGIFEVDEFFDLLQEEPLCDRYSIGNVLTIVDATIPEELSDETEYLFAAQAACCGRVILSHTQEVDEQTIDACIAHLNRALVGIACRRIFTKGTSVIAKNWSDFTEEDYEMIKCSSHKNTGYMKRYGMDELSFQSFFFLNVKLSKDEIMEKVETLWKEDTFGNILRIKGFFEENGQWMELNSTRTKTTLSPIKEGQNIIIVIGEGLDEKKIDTYFPSDYSTIRVQ